MGKKLISTVLVTTGTSVAAPLAAAQSTPAELADLALEDLLNVDLDESEDAERDENRFSARYQYKHARYGGYQNGTDALTFDEVLFEPGETRTSQNYPVVPTYIDQKVHSLSLAYRVSDQFYVDLSVPYVWQATDHISSVPDFPEFILYSEGIGDVAVGGVYQKSLSKTSQLSVRIGLKFPTGSIDQTGDTPRNGAGTLERLPYTMQLGSGTYDLTASTEYTKRFNNVEAGAHASTILRTGRNDNGYRLGDSVNIKMSAAYVRHPRVKPKLSVGFRHIQEIRGRDDGLTIPNPAFPFPAGITDPSNYGGEEINATASIRLCPKKGCKFSISAEYTSPVFQDLNGVQPKELEGLSISTSLLF